MDWGGPAPYLTPVPASAKDGPDHNHVDIQYRNQECMETHTASLEMHCPDWLLETQYAEFSSNPKHTPANQIANQSHLQNLKLQKKQTGVLNRV